MSGRVGDLSALQATTLQTFKDNVKDLLKPSHDDYYLLRWLRARNFDLKKSEEMLRNHASWRKKTGADTILESFKIPEIIDKYLTGGHCGFDKEGNPIWIDPFGRIDIKGFGLHMTRLLFEMAVHQEGYDLGFGVYISMAEGT
ncbi:SEC14-like protein 3 [Argopecten irradians]|uniref:SEC14-like protein 3 n=1 Tax=Argopecten irradians TaxID=31199 RepID=UPI0037116DD9